MVSSPKGPQPWPVGITAATCKQVAGLPGLDSMVDSRCRPTDPTYPTVRTADRATSRWIVRLKCPAYGSLFVVLNVGAVAMGKYLPQIPVAPGAGIVKGKRCPGSCDVRAL